MACFCAYFGGFNQHYALTLRQIEPVPFPFVGTKVELYLKYKPSFFPDFLGRREGFFLPIFQDEPIQP